MHELPHPYVYKWIYIPHLGVSVLLARRELYIFNQTTLDLQIYDLKKLSIRQNLVQFCEYSKETNTLHLLASTIDKENGSQIIILNLQIIGQKRKIGVQVTPQSQVAIHPSILSSPNELLDMQYMTPPNGESQIRPQVMIVSKTGVYFLTLDGEQRDWFEFSKDRVDFYSAYRDKKLKRLKHIDVHGEKAGLLGRIFKGKKKYTSLIELLKELIWMEHQRPTVYVMMWLNMWF